MGRSPCCAKEGMNRGAWTAIEDKLLVDYISNHGEGRWRSIPKEAGLKRCGKSCRLRWLNYLRPDIKRGNITPDEEDLIIRLHKLLGNRWSLIAGRLPGRTDNEIKNYWNTTLVKKIQGGDQAPSPSERSSMKKPGRAKPAPQPRSPSLRLTSKTEATNKAVRTKAVRCSKVVMITPQPQLLFRNAGGIFAANEGMREQRGYNWNNASENECGSLASREQDDTSPTTSGEDYSALEGLPIELSGAIAPGEDPLGDGSDPDFWSMLNDWIMDEDADCHS